MAAGNMASDRQRLAIAKLSLPHLQPGEQIELATSVEVGRITMKKAAKELGKSLAVAAVTAGLFMTVPRPTMMRLVLTDRRLLFFPEGGKAPKPSFVLPRAGLEASEIKTSGWTKRFSVSSAADADSLVRLQFNFGWRQDVYVVAAAFRPETDAETEIEADTEAETTVVAE